MAEFSGDWAAPHAGSAAAGQRAVLQYPIDPAAADGDTVVAALAAYLARLAGRFTFDVRFGDPTLRACVGAHSSAFATHVPLRVALPATATVQDALARAAHALAETRQHGSYLRDLPARYRHLPRPGALPIVIDVCAAADLDQYVAPEGAELAIVVAADGGTIRWDGQAGIYALDSLASMHAQFVGFVADCNSNAVRPLGEVSLLTETDRQLQFEAWTDTARDVPRDACIQQLFEAQVDRTPDATAVVFERESLTYVELDRRANQLAHHLRGLGVSPDSLVGICLSRSLDLVVALLAVHKAGGAYVPLDPAFPQARLDFMAADAHLQVLLTERQLRDRVTPDDAAVIEVDSEREALSQQPTARLDSQGGSHDLAYVIYTSGSTGQPKGVMVEHRHAVNFFVGMDDRLDHATPADPRQRVWLAVTSLSFDISVLELFWTLTRGFKVVLYADQHKLAAAGAQQAHTQQRIDFSLFYFASDEGESSQDKYRLLLDGARFADTHGFSAIWTPERHFHAFGGLYPNPSVTSAAIAAVTTRLQIRAGSVVVPLHSPIRVAEEWAVVDNISGGRVGISFAPGWQPDDFVLQPGRFAARKTEMYAQIETVRALWRGDRVDFAGPLGRPVAVSTLPRPIQPELPIWITAAGTPETYEQAGRLGAGVLTHLLGQTVAELGTKLERYRAAWRDAGHPGRGQVTLMLHTFVGDDEDRVRETVRQPLKEYLRSSVDLIRKAAWTFPTFTQQAAQTGQSAAEVFDSTQQDLSDEEMDALLEHAFERYYRTSGLFGTPTSCLAVIEQLKALGVDEVACLIDFGIPSATALDHLGRLHELLELSNAAPAAEPAVPGSSVGTLLARHAVTHLQCTPSMAGMLLLDEPARAGLSGLTTMMVGGEALPVPLARELRAAVSGAVINMYGPTETTIWSATHEVAATDSITVPIGRPIANTQLYVLDPTGQPLPIGLPGELYIGGEGVVRGYLHRPELNAERFLPDPFASAADARMYRTGDLVRYRPDGEVEFLGRLDHQVKIRGYRIELGEIETRLAEHPAIREAVVIAREDVPGDKRLVGYVIGSGEGRVDAAALRAYVAQQLPDYMVPAHIVSLSEFPLTPNAKVDRRALPPPDLSAGATGETIGDPIQAAPRGELERVIAGHWSTVLNVPAVSVTDNFFELGGHSLLMVQLHHRLREELRLDLAITDLFRFPTVRSLAEHLSQDAAVADAALQDASADRASTRKELMQRRRLQRQGSA